MRPLDKGPVPLDEHGEAIAPTDYQSWRKALIDRIGYYCAYCNIPLSHNLQVEHVVPKDPPPGYTPGDALAWDNMLLACGPCNNAKSNTPVNAAAFYLPENHNTHLAFTIENHAKTGHAIVAERPGLMDNQHQKARRTIDLTQLDNTDERDKIVDIRSIRRKDAMEAVRAMKEIFDHSKSSPTYNADTAAENVARQAKVTGFFSLWFDAFDDEPAVMRTLVGGDFISGTAENCFDIANNFRPIPRNPDIVADPL